MYDIYYITSLESYLLLFYLLLLFFDDIDIDNFLDCLFL
jgi:hypothetical protein